MVPQSINFTDCTASDFSVWNSTLGDFTPCFFHICIQFPVFGVFVISSAYYTGRRTLSHVLYTQWNSYQSAIIYIRSAVVGLLTFLPAFQLMIQFGIFGDQIAFTDLAIDAVKTLSWWIHLTYTLRLKRGSSYNTRGPRPIICLWTLTAITSVLEFHTNYYKFFAKTPGNQIHRQVYLSVFISGAEALLQGVYLLTLIPGSIHLEERHYRAILTDASLEPDSVLNHENNSFVGFHEDDGDPMYLGIAKENAGFFSKLIFSWVNQLMSKGSCGYLKYSDDLFDLPTKLSTSTVTANFQKCTLDSANSLIKSLHQSFGVEFYLIGLLKLIGDACGFAGPILLNLLVTYIEEGPESGSFQSSDGYLYVLGMFSSAIIGALATVHFNMKIAEVNLKIRAAIVTSIYRKTVLMNSTSLEKFSSGEIINHMSTDTDRITNFCQSFHAIWSLPIQIAVALYLLHEQIGVAFVAGVIFTVLLIPVNRLIANKIGDLSTKMMMYKDQRVKLMSEILYGIRVVKFHSWERFFAQRVNSIRKEELSNLKGRKYLDALCVYFWATTPILVSVLSFGTYILLGNQLTAARVFTSLALFNMLISPLNAIPWVLNGIVESWVSLKRVSILLQTNESSPETLYTELSPNRLNTHDIVIEDATFDWENDPVPFRIFNVNAEIKRGQFIGIVGDVGSGKSSLLLAILGELKKVSGTLKLRDSNEGFGVVFQNPWIQRGSIRRNILFGRTYNANRYNEVIDGCCLDQDLTDFALGDDTLVGDHGSTLSGGQKVRIALARAVYQDKSVYLLDDIFSAVDFKVAKLLYHNCIMGLLKDKTRIICTHHVKFLRSADLILVVDGGKIINKGTPSEILPVFFDDDMCDDSTSPPSPRDSLLKRTPSIESGITEPSITYDRMAQSTDFINKPEVGEVNEEHQHQGSISSKVYKAYLKAVGRPLSILVMISLLCMQASKNASDLWLAHWVTASGNSSSDGFTTTSMPITFLPYVVRGQPIDDKSANLSSNEIFQEVYRESPNSWVDSVGGHIPLIRDLDSEVKYFFTVFILIGVVNSIFTLARAFLFAYGGVQGGRKIHIKLLNVVVRAKMKFFDKTPIGRIINRFSSDTSTVDDSLPFILNILLAQLYGVLGTLILTCYALPWILVVIVPLLLVVNNIQQYYRHTARQLRRLGSVTLSPIYAHFSETLKGLVTIRGMRATRRFEHENEVYLEANQKAVYSTQAVSQWLSFRLQMVGVLVITGVGLIGVIQHRLGVANAGIIGLAVSYALTITNSISGVVTFFCETEKEMVAVERVYEYISETELESRAPSTGSLPYAWPLQGVVSFQNVSLQYSEGQSYALRKICFETRPCEKIGIVGRTGSGKSSLFQALFRMIDNFEGEIVIDTVNIKHLSLKELRSKLWIIPQDQLIFSGTLRENLDPKGDFGEEDILRAVHKCQLGDLLCRIGGLDGEVGELSCGTKQLVQLGRAILVNAKVVCLDESTANIDQETDKLIQATIRSSFRASTVLTVAHRVTSVLHSDRVIVMKNGSIVEFDRPENLMLSKTSHFYQLAQGNV